MTQSQSAFPDARLRSSIRGGIYLLLLLSPMLFGSVGPGAVLGIELFGAILGAHAFLLLIGSGESAPRKARLLAIPCAVVILVGLFQLVPLPGTWVALIAGPTAESRRQLAAVVPDASAALAPVSLAPGATLDALLRFSAYVLIGLAVGVAVRTIDQVTRVAAFIAGSGAFQAFYGAAEYLSGHQHLLWYPKSYFLDSATGTFVNRNHFAGYLAITFPFAIATVIDAYRRWPPGPTGRRSLRDLPGRIGFRLTFGVVSTSLIWMGILLSDSRAGLAVALVAVATVVLVTGAGRARWFVVLALILPTLWLLGQEVSAPGERFVAAKGRLTSVGGRITVWKATLGIVRDYQPIGSGLGTFESVFPLYRPAEIDKRWNHVHNDWLESAVDGGFPVTLSMLAVLVISLGSLHVRKSKRFARSPFEAATTASIVTVALHGTIDFGLRIPAIAVLCTVVVGLSCVCGPRLGKGVR